MSLDLNRIAGLLNVANESAKHAGALSEIHAAAMDELKKIHEELRVEKVERGKKEAAEAAEKEAERVAKAKAEEDGAERVANETRREQGPAVDRSPGQPNPDVPSNPTIAAIQEKERAVAKTKAQEEEAQAAVERSQPRAVPNIIPEPEPVVDRRGVE